MATIFVALLCLLYASDKIVVLFVDPSAHLNYSELTHLGANLNTVLSTEVT
jgi:hypothetical protein